MRFWLPVFFVVLGAVTCDAAERPNVIVIITDDQGYGDLGCHGNPDLKTPHLDRFASQSVWLRRFFVSPVCAPTRSALMTGRYNYRTGVTDTFIGRALMRPEEVTLAEMLGSAGYRTGIFGKWHLGDNAPLRPRDQGFQESLVLKGGGIGQPSDPPGGESYFDPLLLHNGQLEKQSGYCSDVFTRAALRFIEDSRDKPFFTYLAFNAPHGPLEVADADREPYATGKLSPGPYPFDGKMDQDTTARIYGMVKNIDDNLGRLSARLDELRLADNTIVIFLTDNGPQQPRYKAGLRGLKGTVYEGGVRVPCYVRWPKVLTAGRIVDTMAAHIDLTPTLLEATGTAAPAPVRMDGRSLLPLLRAEASGWPDRTIFMQWHRGDVPELFRAFAARTQTWKLVQSKGVQPGSFDARSQPFELFRIADDPFEARNVAAEHPEIVQKLRTEYEAWFQDVSSAGYAPPRIHLGSPEENPVLLTRQDWRGPTAGWTPTSIGHWEVDIVQHGRYQVNATFGKDHSGEAKLEVAGKSIKAAVENGQAVFPPLDLPAGPAQLQVSTATGGPRYLSVESRE